MNASCGRMPGVPVLLGAAALMEDQCRVYEAGGGRAASTARWGGGVAGSAYGGLLCLRG